VDRGRVAKDPAGSGDPLMAVPNVFSGDLLPPQIIFRVWVDLSPDIRIIPVVTSSGSLAGTTRSLKNSCLQCSNQSQPWDTFMYLLDLTLYSLKEQRALTP
jgi:hypothetical protein